MERADFLTYLAEKGCVLVRTDKKGYSVVRNVINWKSSGIPVNDPLLDATVCRICKTLGIDSPEQCQSALGVVELAHSRHSSDNE